MPGLKIGLVTTAIYLVIVAIGLALIHQVDQGAYGTPDMVRRFWVVELILTALTLFVALRYFGWAAAGFGRLNVSALIWVLPAYSVLAVMIWDVWPSLTEISASLLFFLALTTLLIGFSEELMFRGILLRGAMTRLSVIQAMMLSAVAFSVLHVFNGFAGQSLDGTLQHVAFTFLIGFALAPIALKLGNLWPLIIWHWLWNFALFAGSITDVIYPYAFAGILLQVIISIWLWTETIRN
ncbi:CPBP family intramembrane glutamic endopeptidase [Yoonia sp. 2307UL14-13]|uniref:CPBP family intramembrane glutamic endopeptidase n=1 Tax=Yoonia sp. 2307UL14-13 TaxID=3126506 RepID=UPI00309EA50A